MARVLVLTAEGARGDRGSSLSSAARGRVVSAESAFINGCSAGVSVAGRCTPLATEEDGWAFLE